jgi:hypothetical protein
MKHKKHYIGVVISRIICNNCMYEFLSTSGEAHLGKFMIISHIYRPNAPPNAHIDFQLLATFVVRLLGFWVGPSGKAI